MAKLTLTDLTQLSSNETSAVTAINNNNTAIEAALELTLTRSGTAPNTLTADLDMNSKKLLNVAAGTGAADGVNFAQLTAATGQVPGLSMTMETTQTDSDQGNGKVWFNAAVASATIMYVDDLDSGGGAIATFVQTWDNSTNVGSRGYIYVVQKASAVNYAVFEIDGAVTDASGYTKIPVNYMSGDGTLADTDAVSVHFTRTGDKGAVPATLEMLWESTTTDTDQGVGKLWLNNGTIASASVLYIDDVDNAAGTSINSQVDTWDDSTTVGLRGTITFVKQTDAAIFATFNVTGAVTSASTYSKIVVTHVTSAGSFTDGDVISVQFVRTGDKGATGSTGSTGSTGAQGPAGEGDMNDLVDDTTPQLGGDLDCNGSQIQWSKGADVASNGALAVLTDGNYFDVTGTTTITSINTTGGAGTLIKLHFDGVVQLTHHSANLILAGAANFTTEAGDELEFVEYGSGTYRMTGWCLAGTAPGGGGGGAFLGEGASGASVGSSGDIIRVNEQTLNTSQTMAATDNGSATGPLTIASGVTVTLSSGATFKVL